MAEKFALTGAKTVHFRPKQTADLSNYAKINLINCSRRSVTRDETPQVLSSRPPVMHD